MGEQLVLEAEWYIFGLLVAGPVGLSYLFGVVIGRVDERDKMRQFIEDLYTWPKRPSKREKENEI